MKRETAVINGALRILLVTNALILLAGAMLGPIYALFVERVGGDLLDASLAGGIYAFAAGLTTIISGRYADKIKENELIIVLGYAMMGLGFFLYLFVDSVMALFAIQVVIGFGEAIYSPPFDAVYSKHMVDGHAGVEWGLWESMNYFVATAGAVIGGLLATAFGFNLLFILMAVLCFGSALYIYLLPRKAL